MLLYVVNNNMPKKVSKKFVRLYFEGAYGRDVAGQATNISTY